MKNLFNHYYSYYFLNKHFEIIKFMYKYKQIFLELFV